MALMAGAFVKVLEELGDNDSNVVELPCDNDGTLLLSTLQAQFTGASGLRYVSEAEGGSRSVIRGVRLDNNKLYPPYNTGWGSEPYHCVFTSNSDVKRDNKEAKILKMMREIREKDLGQKTLKSKQKKASVPLPNARKSTSIQLAWLLANNDDEPTKYTQVKGSKGGLRKLTLDRSKSYNVEDIIEASKKIFIDVLSPNSKRKFKVENLNHKIGYSDGTIIEKFTENDDFWTYCESRGIILWKLKLNLLSRANSLDRNENCEQLFEEFGEKNNLEQMMKTPQVDSHPVIDIFYYIEKTSKYSNNLIISEKRKYDIYNEDLHPKKRDEIPLGAFDPIDYGYKISRIIVNGQTLLSISVNIDDGSRCFDFPSSSPGSEPHSILFGIEELNGEYDGSFGMGVISNCSDACIPTISYFKNGQMIKQGKCLFWVCNMEGGDYSFDITCHQVSGNITDLCSSRNAVQEQASYETGDLPVVEKKDIIFSNHLLGAGAQGKITLGSWLGTPIAIKTIKQSRGKEKYREVNVLSAIRHPGIVQIMGVCFEMRQFHVLLEYVKGHTLFDVLFDEEVKIKYHLTNEDKLNIVKQLCQAVQYLHGQRNPIIHRDIKPENILISKDNKVAKLCDLGLGKFQKSCTRTTVGQVKGTLMYMAPEIILKGKESSKSSDVWALGCTIVELFTEDYVWNLEGDQDEDEILKEKLTKQQMPDMNKVPSEVRGLLERCFFYNPDERCNVEELLQLNN